MKRSSGVLLPVASLPSSMGLAVLTGVLMIL